MSERTVIAQAIVSLDGMTAGPGGDLSWLVPHASSPEMAAYGEGIWRGADTALVGRVNFEGYRGYWPPVAADPAAPPRDRALATWLDEVEKVVFSRTLDEPGWHNARVARDAVEEVRALKAGTGRDLLVLNSTSIIRALLGADLIDELRLTVAPAIAGGGLRLLDAELGRSDWELAGALTVRSGAVALHHRRVR